MDSKKQYSIAMVLFTSGIDYDDRIRKEILSIQKLYNNVSFKIFAVEEGKNREESGVTSYGVPYRIPYLKTREKYKSGTHTLQKAWDFYKSIKYDLNDYDALWCADYQTFLFVLLASNKPIVWDLHEIPHIFLSNPIKKSLFYVLEKKANVIIHANKARLDYLHNIGLASHLDKHYFLRNYPQINEIDQEYDEDYEKFSTWVGEDRCVYLQGITNSERADVESIEAVLRIEKLKAVVVGRILDNQMKQFEERFGKDELQQRVYFTGQLKQLKTPQYIRKCFIALVFYKNNSINNWLCEPNRLFQNVLNGNPVVVGNNPPMKEFVEMGGFGISVDSDGTDSEKITMGIRYVTEHYVEIKENIKNNSRFVYWDSQETTIKKIIEKFLCN